jgi:hypothetical protein
MLLLMIVLIKIIIKRQPTSLNIGDQLSIKKASAVEGHKNGDAILRLFTSIENDAVFVGSVTNIGVGK